MEQGRASRTALGAAGRRAAHQALDGGVVFADPLALAILGDDAEEAIAAAKERPETRGLRFFIAMRSRFAEDCAKAAIAEGVRQILVLGAGLDTFAYRLEAHDSLKVFELDHPATQGDKRRRLAEASIAEPPYVAYVAHDFEHGSMTAALEAGGLDTGRRVFVLWLGVTPYLTEEAVFATLSELARFSGGAEVVFDYPNPPDAIEEPEARDARACSCRARGVARRAVPLPFRHGRPARARAFSRLRRDRGPRPGRPRRALSAPGARPPAPRPGRPCRPDGDAGRQGPGLAFP